MKTAEPITLVRNRSRPRRPRPGVSGDAGRRRRPAGGAGDPITTDDNVMWSGHTILEFTDPTPAQGFTSVTLGDDDPEQDTSRSVTVTVTVTSQNGDRVEFLTGTMH